MGKGYIQPWEPVVPAAQGIDRMRDRGSARDSRVTPRGRQMSTPGPRRARVILQVPDLYGNIISSALDVIIEPDDATDACARKV